MGYTISQQTLVFFQSILLGAALGVFFDIFRIIRVAVNCSKFVIVLQDLMFSFVCALSTFLFFLVTTGGQVRIYAFLGELIGFTVYHFTVGEVVIGVSKVIIAVFLWACNLIYKILIYPVFLAAAFLGKLFEKILTFCLKPVKKLVDNLKIILKQRMKILYNTVVYQNGGKIRGKVREGLRRVHTKRKK